MNKKYFDIGSSNTFHALEPWNTISYLEVHSMPYGIFRHAGVGYDDTMNYRYLELKHDYNYCINNHSPRHCKQRELIEGNPFTRPMGPRKWSC